MPRTRSTKPAASESTDTPASSLASKHQLTPRQGPSPGVFILPKAATPQARIVTLPHPRNGKPSRYLVCPETGLFEFTKISAPNSAPRSWLIETRPNLGDDDTDKKESDPLVDIVSSSDMFVATAIDALFLVLPSLVDATVPKGSDEKTSLFLSSDDYFDKLPEESSHLAEILQWEATRALIESRMEVICDTVEAGDEKMFRLSEKKLLATLLAKAERISDGGLPPTLEEKFVKRALEAPILLHRSSLAAKLGESQAAVETAVESDASTPVTDSAQSQSTTVTADSNSSFVSQPCTAATSFAEDSKVEDAALTAIQASAEVTALQRLHVAFDFICSRYIPAATVEQLKRYLSQADMCSVDFSPLDKYLAALAELRAEAIAANSTADYSRKRMRDGEEDDLVQEKKRKLEEEKKKRRANESRGVRELKKVNTSGMMKLSHFFRAK
ncbi:Ribonuclease H2, subunit B [Metarhizium album ARSEF 1941]|uniref:Ribonuclease H2 subunit B n=1 Tax=Metarhizium album (strain ARSEF 1941) TaxID=1081103 RepID=A0A0B2X0A6_METAS|nr:Ribonuclease H2, subunit B [Metarhizium album ARSEF 1941]KHN99117.1 Ribonuclease H2, subunit B [Metarhizium album ARSEF 1941]